MQRATSGTNAVFSPDGDAAIVGYEGQGWLIVTPSGTLSAQTEAGVELVLEELNIAPLGWQ